MAFLKVFRRSFIDPLMNQISEGRGHEFYDLGKQIVFCKDDVLIQNKIIVPNEIFLRVPDDSGKYDFENAVSVFEYLKDLDPTMATDSRLWAYLTHVTFWDYMLKRWPIRENDISKKSNYIINHWFVRNLSPRSLVDNGIALLWWGVYLTYDETRDDKYELTKEFFSMLDYTRTLMTGSLGRDRKFLHAFLEYAIENKEIFKNYKESKVRSFVRKMNFVAGYKAVTFLSVEEIKRNISKYKNAVINEPHHKSTNNEKTN